MSRKQPDDAPIDVNAVRADDALVEDIRGGAQPPAGDQLAEILAALRDEAQR